MLGVLATAVAEGRSCALPGLGVPVAGEEDFPGICVCGFMDYYEMGQSKVSYHLGKLEKAGLVWEGRRGKWGFYSLNGGTAWKLLAEATEQLGSTANPIVANEYQRVQEESMKYALISDVHSNVPAHMGQGSRVAVNNSNRPAAHDAPRCYHRHRARKA